MSVMSQLNIAMEYIDAKTVNNASGGNRGESKILKKSSIFIEFFGKSQKNFYGDIIAYRSGATIGYYLLSIPSGI